MKALVFDPYSGASGDMIMGCLLDLGADAESVKDAVRSVGCELEISREKRAQIAGTRALVITDRRYKGLHEALSILEKSSLEGPSREMALSAVEALAGAEGRVHGVAKEEAHFHEVGALDALADIAGSCAALASLAPDRVLSLPISVGGGTISSAHGLLPVPGPAALQILTSFNMPWRGGPVRQELLTPTGAALLAVLVDSFEDSYPTIRADRVGYGAGGRDLTMPNALRAVIGEVRHHHPHDAVVQIETNVDDVTGETLGYLIDLLMDEGALDVSVLPAVMKKGRPGHVIRALARPDEIEMISTVIMRETGSLGVRVFESLHRFKADRETLEVDVHIGGRPYRASVKVSRLGDTIIAIKPEHDDCRRIASETGLPLRVVSQKIEEEGHRAL